MNNKIKLDDIKISESVRTLCNKDMIIVGNIVDSGLWIKIPKSHYDYVVQYIGKPDGYRNLMNSLCTQKESDYYTELIEKLAEIHVLKRNITPLKSDFFGEIAIELTTACNLKCKHCSGRYGEREVSTLSSLSLVKILNFASTQGVKSITLTGGEIFCIPNINSILEFVRSHYNGIISIITNATLLNEDNIVVLKKCVDEINISLDGYDKNSVDFIRGNNVFDKVVNSINLLHHYSINNISLSMVLTSDNSRHVEEFKKLCKNLNVNPIVRYFSIKGRALDNYSSLIFEEDMGREDDILNHINMLSACTAGVSTLSISADNIVSLCPAIENNDIKLGTVDELNEITKRLYHIWENCVVDLIEPCKSCNVRYFCSSKCPAINMNVFMNSKLRERRCQQNKEQLQKNVWG